MGVIDANACKPGTKLLLDGELYNVVERDHHKPGKGGAFVRFKLKGIVSGKVIDHTVRAGTRMESAEVGLQRMQFLYKQSDGHVFMDLESYEQFILDEDLLGFGAALLREGAEVAVTVFEGRPIGVQLPQKMVFEVVDTIDNPARGNTATATTKPATLETGITVQVPTFVKTGDRISILTEDGTYLERV